MIYRKSKARPRISSSCACTNSAPFRESVGNRNAASDQPISATRRSLSPHQCPQHSYTSTVSARDEAQRQGRESLRTVQQYSRIFSKRCAEIYKIDKYYVGLLKEVRPPSPVQTKWDQEVRPDLERHLCRATSMLPKSMQDKEVITEPILCMAGKKRLPISIPLNAGVTYSNDSVALYPTVWIHCGSKKCKKKVVEAIRLLSYLDRFLVTFDMDAPHASLYAPWPAARGDPPQSPRLMGRFEQVSFAIQDSTSDSGTICGARARFTFETSNGIVERYSTIGGLVVVGDSLFAMTTAHTIVNCWSKYSHSALSGQTGSTSNTSSDTDPDLVTSSESGDDASTDSSDSPSTRMASLNRPSIELEEVHETRDGMWMDAQPPKIIAYMDQGTTNGDYSFPIRAPRTSDFALIDPGSITTLSNEYYNPEHNTIVTISDHVSTGELLCGDVWIITSCGNAPLKGYMLEGDASMILRGTIMHTKKIQVAPISGMQTCMTY